MLRLLAWQSSIAAQPVGGAFSASQRDQFLANARRFLGQPYLWGGGHGATFSKPGPVDCSGLVQQAARLSGFNLDGTADMQQARGTPVALSLSALKPGDLVFVGNPAEHVGIYIGNNQVLEAPHTGDHVKIVPMTGYGWTDARRYFDQSGAPASVSPSMPADSRAAAPTPKPKPGPGGTYVVQANDTLWAIAARVLGDSSRWQEIYALNQGLLSDPYVLLPGTIIRLPGPDAAAPSSPPSNTPTPIPTPPPTPPVSAPLDTVRQQATQMLGAVQQQTAQTLAGVQQGAARIAYASSYFLQQTAPVADAKLQRILQGMAGR